MTQTKSQLLDLRKRWMISDSYSMKNPVSAVMSSKTLEPPVTRLLAKRSIFLAYKEMLLRRQIKVTNLEKTLTIFSLKLPNLRRKRQRIMMRSQDLENLMLTESVRMMLPAKRSEELITSSQRLLIELMTSARSLSRENSISEELMMLSKLLKLIWPCSRIKAPD